MRASTDITGIHYEVSDDLKRYIMRKLTKLERFVPKAARQSLAFEVKLSEQKTKSNRNQCEIIVHLPDRQLTAKDATLNMYAAVDIVEAKIKNQLKKYKGQHGGDAQDHHGRLRRMLRFGR